MQQDDRIAMARFGHMHAQARKIYKAVLNPVELRKRRGHSAILLTASQARNRVFEPYGIGSRATHDRRTA
jgi:hypothetical protein